MAIFTQFQAAGGAGFGSVVCRRGGVTSKLNISVTADSGGLKVNTPYSATFVEQLKLIIPATSRKWDATAKAWFVSKEYAVQLKELIDRSYGCDVVMPTVIAADNASFEVTFQADYVANCKNEASSVHMGGGWNAKIPERVLRAWFKQTEPGEAATLYGVLGLDRSASDADIKRAYKRAARQWHPDVCREENAQEMFMAIRNAYNILSSPDGRKKYDAGLAFEMLAKQGHSRNGHRPNRYTTFTPTLRCGKLTVKAKRELGVLVVEEILAWDDIENELGQIMVSFWAGDSWSVAWI